MKKLLRWAMFVYMIVLHGFIYCRASVFYQVQAIIMLSRFSLEYSTCIREYRVNVTLP